MHSSSIDMAHETRFVRRRGANSETVAVSNPFGSLLDCSIRLRDLYRYARRRSCAGQLLQLRLIFDAHYKEQVSVVDVLVDRVRMSGGAGEVFAGNFLQDPQLSWDSRSHNARFRMLRTLLDAHELILSVALTGGDEKKDEAWIRDFAVGQVVLTNAQQSRSIGDLLGNRSEDPSASITFQWTSD
jgi:hypothetical protein